jgi:hypothetical protein
MNLAKKIALLSASLFVLVSTALASNGPCKSLENRVSNQRLKVLSAERELERVNRRVDDTKERNEVSLANYDARIENALQRYLTTKETARERTDEYNQRNPLCFKSPFLCPDYGKRKERGDIATGRAYRFYLSILNNRPKEERRGQARIDAVLRTLARAEAKLLQRQEELAALELELAQCQASQSPATPTPTPTPAV